MPERDLVKTGIAGLDDILAGGIRAATSCWSKAPSGPGRRRWAWSSSIGAPAEFDEPGHHRPVRGVARQARSRCGASSAGTCRRSSAQGRLKIVFTTRAGVPAGAAAGRQPAPRRGGRRSAPAAFSSTARAGGHGGQRHAARRRREAFHVLAEGLQRETAHRDARRWKRRLHRTPVGASLPEESIADTVIRLRMEERQRAVAVDRDRQVARPRFPDGPAFVPDRRRQAGSRCIGACRRPGASGTRRRPSTRRRASPPAFPASTTLVNGGYFLGSTTVVAGISGVGKSVMGLQYLAEGARLGERSLMLTLDEPVPQIIRNASSIGIDLQPPIDGGLVRLVVRPAAGNRDRPAFPRHREDRGGVQAEARGDRQPLDLWLEPGHRRAGCSATSFTRSWR